MAMNGKKVFQAALSAVSQIQRQPSASIKPSSIGCSRRMTYELLRIPARGTMAPRDYVMLASGRVFHQLIQEVFTKGLRETEPTWTVQEEVKLNGETCRRAKDLFVRASVDLVIQKPPAPEVIEIKTVGKAGMGTLRGPKSYHFEQLNMYLYLLECSTGHLMYVNRTNPLDYLFYEMEYDEPTWLDTRQKITTAINSAMEGRLPPTETSEMVCRICPFAYRCDDRGAWIDAYSSEE